MIGLLLAMYPARWRKRYGEEFRAVLESRPLGPFDFADVLIGALDARLTRFRFAGTAGIDGGPLVMLRLGGYGAIAGGLLWFVGLAVASRPGGDDGAWLALIALGTVGLLLAFIGLSAFQAHSDPILAWAAFVVPGLGTLVSVIGATVMALGPGDEPLVLGTMSAWSVWMIGLLGTFVGSLIFAVATIRAAVFSRRAAIALAVSSAVVLLFMLGLIGTNTQNSVAADLLLALVMGSFAASWIALGAMALRRGPIRAVAPA
ncbi:MAG: hypothetical protein ACJ78L_02375 [Chloroflexota bacterium]